ncbi:MAG TPA: NADPH-dependent FMN reductase [Methylibium sp.]|uniref:NADPH-dependent FMN reductase n=1 Tax=Methylibium sp. TaxID=2067992 RepID=UPI002DB79F80|nr:NADPH-dependent FMN reductase [Methylibium sp.]HEU4459548.1 NADPH-dependent FMN reductase [Methylibium sp.]
MSRILSLLGSPSARSRSGALLAEMEGRLAAALDVPQPPRRVVLRELPAAALLAGDAAAAPIVEAIAALREARLVLVATPIYKAAYSGLLKAFLDVLPQDALRGKTIVPLASGGSLAHLLALDYALRPVLAALGAHDIRAAVFATDAQLPLHADAHRPVHELGLRLDRAVADLLEPAEAWAARVEARPVAVVPRARIPALDVIEARCSA